MDDDKTLGELQLKEAKGCRLAVEIAPTAVWQEPRAFKAFKWTQGGLTRVTVQLPIPDSPSVLQTDLDVDWDSILSDVKKRATSLLKEKIKALSPAQQQALAGSQKSNAALGAKGAKKEMRLVFQSASWGDQGFPVTDETASLRDIYQPYSTFDDEADVAPLPVKVLARLMPTTSSVGAAAHMPETQVGPVEVRTCLVKDGKRSMEVKVHLQREMLLPQCREVLARALKVEHAASDYHMRSTNWAGDAADDVDEDETITFGSIMHTLNIKERDLILLERGAPRKALQSGFVRISVWHHVPTARSTLLAECDAMQACNRPDGQVSCVSLSFLFTYTYTHTHTHTHTHTQTLTHTHTQTYTHTHTLSERDRERERERQRKRDREIVYFHSAEREREREERERERDRERDCILPLR
jgi:hypothetical protein